MLRRWRRQLVASGNFRSHEAYGSMSVTTALIFSFAASDLSSCLDPGDGDTKAFVRAVLLSISTITSAFTVVVMSQQYYHCAILLERFPERLQQFTHDTFSLRQTARFCLWFSLAAFLIALGVQSLYAYSNDKDLWKGGIIATLMMVGATTCIVVQKILNRHFIAAKRYEEDVVVGEASRK